MRVKTILLLNSVIYQIEKDVPGAGENAYKAAYKTPGAQNPEMDQAEFIKDPCLSLAWLWIKTKGGTEYWREMNDKFWEHY